MTPSAPSTAYLAAEKLDHLRGALLRWTMGIPLLRAVYTDRARRLWWLYLAFAAAALAFAVSLPLWQLILGPVVFGAAHLGASVRYFHHGAAGPGPHEARGRVYTFILLASVTYCVARIARDLGWLGAGMPALSEWEGSMTADGVFMAVILLGTGWIYRSQPRRMLLGAALITPLTLCLWRWPFATTGILVLVHNVVGFFYWISGASTLAERRGALSALGIFAGINLLIFGGALDPLYELWARGASLPFSGLTYAELGRLIFPWNEDPDLLMRGVVAFAFGQSVHYYVWLKAIPDTLHSHPIPTSFRQSVRLLGEDFGPQAALLVVYLVAASTALWFIFDMASARSAYFLIAGFHGYVEIAGLALLGGAAAGASRLASASEAA